MQTRKKRPRKKLALRRETLRTLSKSDLDRANGGFTYKPSVYNCNPTGGNDYYMDAGYGGGWDDWGGGWDGGWY